MLPDPSHLTSAQYITHVLVVYNLIVLTPGLAVLGIWILADYFRARRNPEIEADYQRRRAAAEIANS